MTWRTATAAYEEDEREADLPCAELVAAPGQSHRRAGVVAPAGQDAAALETVEVFCERGACERKGASGWAGQREPSAGGTSGEVGVGGGRQKGHGVPQVLR